MNRYVETSTEEKTVGISGLSPGSWIDVKRTFWERAFPQGSVFLFEAAVVLAVLIVALVVVYGVWVDAPAERSAKEAHEQEHKVFERHILEERMK